MPLPNNITPGIYNLKNPGSIPSRPDANGIRITKNGEAYLTGDDKGMQQQKIDGEPYELPSLSDDPHWDKLILDNKGFPVPAPENWTEFIGEKIAD